MAQRVVSIKLQADATGFVSGFNQAGSAADALKNKTQTAGQRMAESARSNREAWSTVGTGLTAVGVAITGIGVAALKTGVQYNTLQQTTRAALTTLLGSAAAANAQMDKLDDFARNSPFAKDTFIRAQQQMLAFGIETSKVIPYLDAVQNAVAAAGGSNADIEAIVATMSKIQSSAKLTAQDLNEFGNRGVNAAELIGSQMGKTGAQIRADITSGSLDATAALDALAAGMSQRFDGAADNVKNTFAGAMDRVKAAWRDFSSELARPLVDPDGGGALVDLLNWAADAMRAFEDLPEPVKNATTAITGVTGATALLGGGFMLLLPRILDFTAALATLGVTKTAIAGGFRDFWKFLTGPWGIAMVAAAAATYAFQQAMDGSRVSADQFEVALKRGESSLKLMQQTATQNESGITKLFVDVESSLQDIPELFDRAGYSAKGFWADNWNDDSALKSIEEFGTQLATLATTDLPAAQAEFRSFYDEAGLDGPRAINMLSETMPGLKSALIDAADAAGMATDDATILKIAMGELIPETRSAGEVASDSAGGFLGMAEAAQNTWSEVDNLISSLMYFNETGQAAEAANAKLQQTFVDVAEHVKNAQAGVDGYSLGLDANTVAGAENRAMLADMAAQIQDTAAKLFEQEINTLGVGQATQNFNARLQDGHQKLVDTARNLGMSKDEAERFAASVHRIPDQKEVEAIAITAAAESNLNYLTRDRVARINAIWSPSTGTSHPAYGVYERAHGGTVGYAGGGTAGWREPLVRAARGVTAGGTVYGPGTSKSDSIPALLSRGEEVIQEPYASMNRQLLKSINRGELHQGMLQPQVIVVPSQGGTRSVTQNNVINQIERDPRLLMRQFGRELEAYL